MKISKLRFILGMASLFFGGGLVIFALVIPYSRILSKEKIDFNDDDVLPVLPKRQAVLPVFSSLRGEKSQNSEFFITIERLGIRKARVRANLVVNNQKPDYLKTVLDSLGHLKGTSLPGRAGNSVVFGHSAWPYLYNPRHFQTIFSKIDELRFGDTIVVENGSEVFKYRVEKGGLVDGQVSLADFVSRKSRLTLLTCYPPGFKTQRYAVKSVLVD